MIESLYNHSRGAAEINEEPSKTQQHFANDANVNNILKKYEKTGFLVDPTVRRSRMPTFGDASKAPELMDAYETVKRANEMFMSLPAEIRFRFNNSPYQIMQFFDDPKNIEEAQRLGLIPTEQQKKSMDAVAGTAKSD